MRQILQFVRFKLEWEDCLSDDLNLSLDPLFPSFPRRAPLSVAHSCWVLTEVRSSIRMSDNQDVTQLKPRRLLRGEITYSAAKEEDHNVLHELEYRHQKVKFFTHLYRNRKLIEKIVAHHLGWTSKDTCHLVDVEDWIDGSFNVCIRVDVDARARASVKQLMIRFPLPYRIGEKTCSGNSDEKIRCEAGTYAWLQETSPDVPIPKLYGFGLSAGQSVRTFSSYIQWRLLLTTVVHSS